ncbi:DUF6929 family protein [Pontibacter cellulosilyticus]|uniref:Uncharacterized protein n=1 Tax=Pontibacter cellulosilyticus TaxID=1720253 RepID=A0A923SJB9_9BACT|nr:hypothetical protein [Pontibacter cellulosilyticus]MBC5993744.1 hypothetical protein [Pontibacter cellulosilyticus]
MKSLSLKATMVGNQPLQEIPSASGIEFVEGAYYVIGDDSPYLYQLDEQFKLINKYSLFESGKLGESGRLPKAEKPDLESIAGFTYGRDNMLLIFGSGASEARNKGYLVNLSEKGTVKELDLSRFYTFLKRTLKIETEGLLNIEALAMDNIYTYLLQRPLGSGVNVLFRFDSDDFKDFLLRNGPIPAVAVYHFTLPGIGQNSAGFSGAYALGDKLFITASVEDTPNAIDDGEVLGSLLGVIDLNALPYATNSANPLAVPAVQVAAENGAAFKGKVESLVVKKTEVKNRYHMIIVTDDDRGGSKLLEVELKLD